MLCGRVLLFLAKLLPLTERSGVNLGGGFNTDNTTPVEEVQEVRGAWEKMGRRCRRWAVPSRCQGLWCPLPARGCGASLQPGQPEASASTCPRRVVQQCILVLCPCSFPENPFCMTFRLCAPCRDACNNC